jgi:hypothetical protein
VATNAFSLVMSMWSSNKVGLPIKILMAISFGIALIVVAPPFAHGQPRCGQYSLDYLVRDERGKVIDANADGLWISSGWDVNDRNLNSLYDVPQAVSDMVGERNFLSYIKYYEPCRFKEPVRLQLTLRGKNMNLIFHAEGQANIVVDSLPFQQGTFEHQLSEREPNSRFYSAQGWKKIGDQAEAVARYPIAFVRGRVVDSATGKPVTNARVSLTSNGYNYRAASNADAKGLYALKVRADQFEKVSSLAVVVTHPDFLDDFAIAVENRQGGLLQSIDGVNVKLTRAVTIAGRVIDEKTGAAPSPKNEIKLKAEYPHSKDLWGSKIGGETEYVAVKPDGTFSIKTGIGKNSLKIDDYGFCYRLKDDQRELDIGPQGRSELVLVLTSPGCKPF